MTALGPGRVKRRTSEERAELFSLFSSFNGACQSGSFLIQSKSRQTFHAKVHVGVFTQPGSKADLAARKCDFCCTLDNGHAATTAPCPFRANRRLMRCGINVSI